MIKIRDGIYFNKNNILKIDIQNTYWINDVPISNNIEDIEDIEDKNLITKTTYGVEIMFNDNRAMQRFKLSIEEKTELEKRLDDKQL
jgi:hypothetical protein